MLQTAISAMSRRLRRAAHPNEAKIREAGIALGDLAACWNRIARHR
jgi:hypothetical protein